MNIKFFITFLILFSTLFSDLMIKTGDNEFVLKKGILFSINSDAKKMFTNHLMRIYLTIILM